MGQNIKWYDFLTNWEFLVNATPLKEKPLITLRKPSTVAKRQNSYFNQY
jgi:hypothetical protein